jgi:hypothetical protein
MQMLRLAGSDRHRTGCKTIFRLLLLQTIAQRYILFETPLPCVSASESDARPRPAAIQSQRGYGNHTVVIKAG